MSKKKKKLLKRNNNNNVFDKFKNPVLFIFTFIFSSKRVYFRNNNFLFFSLYIFVLKNMYL